MSLYPKIRVLTATPTLDTNIYASGDQLGSLMTIASPFPQFLCGNLESLTVIDKAKQSAALSVLFFSSSPTVASSDNGALDISDSEMAAKCVGIVNVATGDYKALNANSVATVQPTSCRLSTSGDNLYAILLSGGTPTYAASDLVLKFVFRVG